jgi:hypothetical protein
MVDATLAAIVTGCGSIQKAGPPPCETQAGIASATSPFPRSHLPRPFPAERGRLAVSYTGNSGARYAGRVTLPAFKVAVAVQHNPCSAKLAQLGTVVHAEGPAATPPGIDTQLLPAHGTAGGPPLQMNVQLAFKVDRGSPLLQAGSCATVGNAGAAPTVAETVGTPLAGYALGLQAGLPFAHDPRLLDNRCRWRASSTALRELGTQRESSSGSGRDSGEPNRERAAHLRLDVRAWRRQRGSPVHRVCRTRGQDPSAVSGSHSKRSGRHRGERVHALAYFLHGGALARNVQ